MQDIWILKGVDGPSGMSSSKKRKALDTPTKTSPIKEPFLLPPSPPSPVMPSPSLTTVNHRSGRLVDGVIAIVRFIDNGEDKTASVYAKLNVRLSEESLSPPPLPKLLVTPLIEDGSRKPLSPESTSSVEHTKQSLWDAMSLPFSSLI